MRANSSIRQTSIIGGGGGADPKQTESAQDQIRESLALALENNWIDIDEDELSDFELDAVEVMIDQFNLEDNILEVQRNAKKAVDSHRHTFLHRFMENTESQLE